MEISISKAVGGVITYETSQNSPGMAHGAALKEQPAGVPTSGQLDAMLSALVQRRFFKLIGGGSLTEAKTVARLSAIYAISGAHCIDITPDPAVVAAVSKALEGDTVPEAVSARKPACNPEPALMVSIPLDPDPHFRKIELDEPACIRCGACLPVCPTEAITLPSALEIAQSLCYGCGRCVPLCPTDALHLLPFQVEASIEAVLSHPRIAAVEIHSRYVDPCMLDAFGERWGPLLRGKLISLCFRVENIPPEQMLAFYDAACALDVPTVMLQIDGAPMSGNDDPEASRPALESAARAAEIFRDAGRAAPIITISGGINAHTAKLLQEPRYAFIAGVGMGTVARQAVWTLSQVEAIQSASSLVRLFTASERPDLRHPLPEV